MKDKPVEPIMKSSNPGKGSPQNFLITRVKKIEQKLNEYFDEKNLNQDETSLVQSFDKVNLHEGE